MKNNKIIIAIGIAAGAIVCVFAGVFLALAVIIGIGTSEGEQQVYSEAASDVNEEGNEMIDFTNNYGMVWELPEHATANNQTNNFTNDTGNENYYDQTGEASFEDFLRNPSKFAGYSYTIDRLQVDTLYDLGMEMDLSEMIEPKQSFYLTNGYMCYDYNSGYRFLLTGSDMLLGYKLLEGDILLGVYTDYVGYLGVIDMPVFRMTYMEGLE